MNISNGCGSCESFGVEQFSSMNQMNQTDQTSQKLAHMVSSANGQTYATNAVNEAMANAGIVSNGNTMMNATNNQSNNQNVQPQQPAKPPVRTVVEYKPAVKVESNKNMSVRANNLLMLGLVVIAALAWNEMVKYYINQAIKLNDGSPTYYIGYAGVAVLLAVAVYNFAN